MSVNLSYSVTLKAIGLSRALSMSLLPMQDFLSCTGHLESTFSLKTYRDQKHLQVWGRSSSNFSPDGKYSFQTSVFFQNLVIDNKFCQLFSLKNVMLTYFIFEKMFKTQV
jgi:hypothetical protein